MKIVFSIVLILSLFSTFYGDITSNGVQVKGIIKRFIYSFIIWGCVVGIVSIFIFGLIHLFE